MGHFEFEMPISHPSGDEDVKETVGYESELRGERRDLEIQMGCKSGHLSECTGGVSQRNMKEKVFWAELRNL